MAAAAPGPPAPEPPPPQRLLRGEPGGGRALPVAWELTEAAESPGGERLPAAAPVEGVEPGTDRGGDAAAAPAGAAAAAEAAALLAAARKAAAAVQAEAAANLAAAQAESAALRAAAAELQQRAAAAVAAASELREAAAAEAAELRATVQAEVERWQEAAAAQAEAARQQALAGAGDEMVALALAVARRILRQELTLRPEAVAAMVAAALARVQGDPAPQLFCAPDDTALLQAAVGLAPEVRSGLTRGDFLIRSREGDIDGRLEAQLAAVTAALASGEEGEA